MTPQAGQDHVTRSPSGALAIWTVYDHPSDFPKHVIARKFYVGMDRLYASNELVKASTLGEVRVDMRRRGLYCMQRHPSDDAKIVETWI